MPHWNHTNHRPAPAGGVRLTSRQMQPLNSSMQLYAAYRDLQRIKHLIIGGGGVNINFRKMPYHFACKFSSRFHMRKRQAADSSYRWWCIREHNMPQMLVFEFVAELFLEPPRLDAFEDEI